MTVQPTTPSGAPSLGDRPDTQPSPLDLSALWSASTFFFALFGTLFGSLPWLSILKNVFRFELYGWVGGLIGEYDRLRDAAVKWVLDFVPQLGITIPATVADFVIIYVLIAMAYVRGNQVVRKIDMANFERDPVGTLEEIRAAARMHGLSEARIDGIIRRFHATRARGVGAWLRFQFSTILTSLWWWRVYFRNLKQTFNWSSPGGQTGRMQMAVFILFLLSAFVGCAFYLLLSRIGV